MRHTSQVEKCGNPHKHGKTASLIKYHPELMTFEKAKITCKVKSSSLFECLYLCWGLSFSPRTHGKGGAPTGGGACRLRPPFWSSGRHCVTIVTTHLLISTIRIGIHLSRAAWVCRRPWAKDTARKRQTRKILRQAKDFLFRNGKTFGLLG